jgi:hypothetical protein
MNTANPMGFIGRGQTTLRVSEKTGCDYKWVMGRVKQRRNREHSRPGSREPRPRGYKVAGTMYKRTFEHPPRLRSLFECLMEEWAGGFGSTAPLFGAGRAELRPRAGALPFFISPT